MAHVSNLDPSRRPPTPSLDRGPVQRRARRAFLGSGMEVMTTPQVARWTHPRGTVRRYHFLREVLRRRMAVVCVTLLVTASKERQIGAKSCKQAGCIALMSPRYLIGVTKQ
jgi:hypothetical protein